MNKKIIYLLTISLSLCACNDASKEVLVSDTDLRARIQILDSGTAALDQVTVNLFDKEGNPICNKNITLSVNGKPLKAVSQKGNYYDISCAYVSSKIPIDKIYYFNILLEDSTNYELAAYIPFKKVKPSNTSVTKDEKGYTIKWKALNNFNELHIVKSIFNSETNTHSDSLIRKRINPIKGQFHIDSAFFQSDSITKVKDFNISFIGLKGGLLNPKLLENSIIEGRSSFSIKTESIIK